MIREFVEDALCLANWRMTIVIVNRDTTFLFKFTARYKMNIAIASSGLGHVARGIEAWAADLGQALHQRGEKVLLCKGAGMADRLYERVVPCWPRESRSAKRVMARMPSSIGWRLGLGSGYNIEQTTFAWQLFKILRRERIDILHVQDPQVALLAQRARTLRLINTRVILAHGTEETPAFLKKIEYVQHLAPWHADEVRAAGVWRSTWTTIPNFIDTELFCPGEASNLRAELGIPPNAVVVMTAAAIKRGHKRIDHLLSEFARLRSQRPVWLVIAGGWEADTDELVRQGQAMLGDRVRFLVRFPRARMPELYRAADLFVMTSLKEMMPIALVEAMAGGLPCLVHRHPVVQWMIGPGGEAVDMAAPGGLAAALQAHVSDPARRQSLGAAARQHCIDNFGRDCVVDRIVEYYHCIMTARTAVAIEDRPAPDCAAIDGALSDRVAQDRTALEPVR